MAIKAGSCASGDVESLIRQIAQPDVRAVVYFFSPAFAKEAINKTLKKQFPHAAVIGASMIGGWGSAGALSKGISALSFSAEEVSETFLAFREGVKTDPAKTTKAVIADLKQQLARKNAGPDSFVGILLVDGLCMVEKVMHEFLVEKDFNIPIVGGAAADELTFSETLVAADEKVSGDALAVLVLNLKIPFFYNHYVHYFPTERGFTITKSDPQRRVVWEIDGQSAVEYYIRMLRLTGVDKLTSSIFAHNPVGVVIGKTVYVRSPAAVVDGKGLAFYCYIQAGTKARILKQGDIIENARLARREAASHLGTVQGALLFNCVFRYLEMQELFHIDAFNKVFEDIPFAGFNTYGEELFTHHNQTLTALFFGK